MSESLMQSIFAKAYQPFYISFLLVCLIISSEVYGRIQRNIGRSMENNAFKKIIITYVVYIIDDLLWIMFYPDHNFATFTTILQYLQTGILAAFTFFWFEFAECYIDGFLAKSDHLKHIFYVPINIAVLTSVIYCFNLVGIIGHTIWPTQGIYAINSSTDFFYMIFAFIHTLICLKREKRQTKRHRYHIILECIMYPAIGSIVSLFIFYVPFIILGILPSIIKILIEMQNAHIYTDALTSINNRYRVDEYLEREWGNISEEHPLIIYLIDVNKFKHINDRFGHIVGDQALIAVADSLKKVASDGVVIGRFGGDEFILVDSKNHDPEIVKQSLNDHLAEIVKKNKFPFSLTVSIGYAKCSDPSMRIKEIQSKADAMLYEDKGHR